MKGQRKRLRWEDMDKGDITLDRLIAHYEVHNRTEGKSPKTVAWHNESLGLFLRFLRRRGYSIHLRDVGLPEAREFVLYLQSKRVKYENSAFASPKEEPLSPHTIQGRVRSLRAFFRWLHEEGYAPEHKLEDLRPPKAPKQLVAVLTEEEIRRILACLSPNTALGARNRAIVVTFLDTGLRLSELVNLKLADAHLQEGYLRVLGKGGKERIVPIGTSAQKALLRYREHFRPEPANLRLDSFFLTLDGQPLTGNSVQTMLQRLGRRAAVPRLHAHLLRHTFATMYLINGGDVFTLQRILGHTTLAMVGNYVNLASAHVAVQQRRYSPMDLIGLRESRPARPHRRGSARLSRDGKKQASMEKLGIATSLPAPRRVPGVGDSVGVVGLQGRKTSQRGERRNHRAQSSS